ncbi:MAG: mechanosensitive ion channel family protein [Halobacteriaceae archaeon]
MVLNQDFIQNIPQIEERLALSVVIIAIFVIGIFLARRVIKSDMAKLDRPLVNILAFLSIVTLIVLSGGGLVLIWQTNPTINTYLKNIGSPIKFAIQAVITLGLVVGGYILTNVSRRVIVNLSQTNEQIDRHQTEILFRTAQVILYLFIFIVVLGIWRVDLGGFLIGAGFLGIVIGMAARQTLGSLIAGFVLMFSRPFEIGDWVEIGDNEGIITDITIVNTRLQTFDGEYVMLPNDLVSSNQIINRSRKGRLRLQLEVGVDYSTNIERATKIAENAMEDVDDILTVPQPQVVLKRFGDSAIILGLRFWIDKPSARRKWRAKTAVVQAVKQSFDAEGIKIPFPQRELSDRPAPDEVQQAEPANPSDEQ